MDQTVRRGWWGRNWKWAVPVGCLGLILLLVVLLVVVVVFFVFSAIKSNDAYAGALEAARSDPKLTEAIGTPIEDGFFRLAASRRAVPRATRSSLSPSPGRTAQRPFTPRRRSLMGSGG